MPKKFLVIFDSELAGVPTFSKLTRQMSNKVPQSVLAFLAAPDFNYLHTIDRSEGQIARCFQKQFQVLVLAMAACSPSFNN
jgi:isocitrate lyase